VQHGAVAALAQLLQSDTVEVLEQVAWLLGNLSGSGGASRDAVIAGNVLQPLVSYCYCLTIVFSTTASKTVVTTVQFIVVPLFIVLLVCALYT
jgi:Armadillo/beta-catenin-like repeat